MLLPYYETVFTIPTWKLLDASLTSRQKLLQTMWQNYQTVYGVTFLRREPDGNLENSENIQSLQSAARGGGGEGGAGEGEAGELLGKEHYAN